MLLKQKEIAYVCVTDRQNISHVNKLQKGNASEFDKMDIWLSVNSKNNCLDSQTISVVEAVIVAAAI